MAEKKNDASSILAKIRQKMNKIDKSDSDDDILLDENDDAQNISLTADEIENYQPSDSVLNNISKTKPSTIQAEPSVKNEKTSINNNLKFEDEDIFQGATLDDEFKVPQNDTNKIDDEDLKFDMDLEIEDESKIKSDTKQEENDFDDLDDINLDELEESDDKTEDKIIEGKALRVEKSIAPSKLEVPSNTVEEADELDNPQNSTEEQDSDDLDLDFLEDEVDDETTKQPNINLAKNFTSNETELDELDDLDDLSEIDEESPKQESFSRTSSPANISAEHNDDNEEEKEEDEDILEEEPQDEKGDEQEEDIFEKEEDEDIFEEESEDEEVNDEKKDNSYQQFYQQQSKPSMISKKAMDEAQQSIKKLVQAVPKKQEMLFERSPAFRSGETIEDMVISMLKPKLEQWFNENLPVMVERIVREEIKKIVPKDEDI